MGGREAGKFCGWVDGWTGGGGESAAWGRSHSGRWEPVWRAILPHDARCTVIFVALIPCQIQRIAGHPVVGFRRRRLARMRALPSRSGRPLLWATFPESPSGDGSRLGKRRPDSARAYSGRAPPVPPSTPRRRDYQEQPRRGWAGSATRRPSENQRNPPPSIVTFTTRHARSSNHKIIKSSSHKIIHLPTQPFITASGVIRATGSASPAPETTAITSSMSL